MVQLGYNGSGKGLRSSDAGERPITVPERGTMIDDEAFESIVQLKFPEAERDKRSDATRHRHH